MSPKWNHGWLKTRLPLTASKVYWDDQDGRFYWNDQDGRRVVGHLTQSKHPLDAADWATLQGMSPMGTDHPTRPYLGPLTRGDLAVGDSKPHEEEITHGMEEVWV